MKLTSILASAALVSFFSFSDVPLKVINPSLAQVSAQQPNDPASLTVDQKIAMILANKGKPESAQMMREYFPKQLSPIGIQPGGAGMVVSLYSKTSNVTFSLCTMFDVVVAAKKGKIAKFPPAEVK
ncbi:hypothetical protein OGM63_14445 [Plectonema radiosum NIES-515]|uniref:Uncharacterized protein n=1 Tax=Plectonema radiosum NIES-515 TaxID=2986073 RepID=A0ABT3AZZ5_9CYAN|nr:hypothetical protein [Plectonema radiosum]MCV3214700.1 hypothetical protein [Plectonema radiosum NIES-515]